MKYLISSCLLGVNCRYDGKDSKNEELIKLFLEGKAIPVCPEVLGGLDIPRNPAEIILTDEGKTITDSEGNDLTSEFEIGARAALSIAKIFNAETAILKSNSPSCGCRKIYDGNFSDNLINGEGITAELLRLNGIKVINEKEWKSE